MSTCPRCGGKSRGAKPAHDRSCPERFAASPSPSTKYGPLRPTAPVPSLTNLYDDKQIVSWLAYVGLAGRWCWVGYNQWLRWDGRRWKSARVEHVREAIRRALTTLHEQSEHLPGRDHLLTIERSVVLQDKVRHAVKVDAASVGVSR